MKHALLFILCLASLGLAAQPNTEEIKKLKYTNVKFYLGQKKILHNVLSYDMWAVGKLDIYPAVADSLANFMLDKKNIIIEIGGHSNCVDMQDPMSSSLNAAAYVKNYLASKGVPADRIETRGYGYALPLVPCKDPANPTSDTYANRRIEATITGFIKPNFAYTDTTFYTGQSMVFYNSGVNSSGGVLSAENKNILDSLAIFLFKNARLKIEIGVHTSTKGNADTNLNDSKACAALFLMYLVNKGIDENRLMPVGYGEKMPIVPCPEKAECGEDVHNKNRRVEIKILSVE